MSKEYWDNMQTAIDNSNLVINKLNDNLNIISNRDIEEWNKLQRTQPKTHVTNDEIIRNKISNCLPDHRDYKDILEPIMKNDETSEAFKTFMLKYIEDFKANLNEVNLDASGY